MAATPAGEIVVINVADDGLGDYELHARVGAGPEVTLGGPIPQYGVSFRPARAAPRPRSCSISRWAACSLAHRGLECSEPRAFDARAFDARAFGAGLTGLRSQLNGPSDPA
jgi:hypothetical protein